MKKLEKSFTLAEVLITLGVVGVVAAITLPTLITTIQEKVRNERVRVIKYKFTNATSEMNALGKIHEYGSTSAFVDELAQHYKVLCRSSNIRDCWPYDTINLANDATGDSELTAAQTSAKTVDASTLTTGEMISALALGTKDTETMSIIAGDGTPMIMVFSPVCEIPEDTAHQHWSMNSNGKPETNPTTNCISMIFDINGAAGPNKLGQDVRTLNSLFGYRRYKATYINSGACSNEIAKGYGIESCSYEQDYWAGAMKKCHDIGMHLPSTQTLANIAGSVYGRTDITPKTSIMRNDYNDETKVKVDGVETGARDCRLYYAAHSPYRLTEGNVICLPDGPISYDSSSAVNALVNATYWSSEQSSATGAYNRNITTDASSWGRGSLSYSYLVPLCLGD